MWFPVPGACSCSGARRRQLAAAVEPAVRPGVRAGAMRWWRYSNAGVKLRTALLLNVNCGERQWHRAARRRDRPDDDSLRQRPAVNCCARRRSGRTCLMQFDVAGDAGAQSETATSAIRSAFSIGPWSYRSPMKLPVAGTTSRTTTASVPATGIAASYPVRCNPGLMSPSCVGVTPKLPCSMHGAS